MILANKRRREDFKNKITKELGNLNDMDVKPLLAKFIENNMNSTVCDEVYKGLFKIMRKKSEKDFKI